MLYSYVHVNKFRREEILRKKSRVPCSLEAPNGDTTQAFHRRSFSPSPPAGHARTHARTHAHLKCNSTKHNNVMMLAQLPTLDFVAIRLSRPSRKLIEAVVAYLGQLVIAPPPWLATLALMRTKRKDPGCRKRKICR